MPADNNISLFLKELDADLPETFETDVDMALVALGNDTDLCIELVGNAPAIPNKNVKYQREDPRAKVSKSDGPAAEDFVGSFPIHIPGGNI